MDRYELRRLDYSLTEDHEALQAAYKDFFKTHCSIETVRAAEAGFDKNLWERLCAMGATTMALPESVGGEGATLVDLTLVAEEIGRSLAPVPWIDHVCAARLLARLGAVEADVVNGKQIVALDPQHDSVSGVRLIPTGSIADHIVVREGDDVVRLTFATRPAKVDNIGRLPMGWVDPAAADNRTVVASEPDAVTEYQRALDEWRLLTAAALVGLVEETMTIAAEFAKTRYTLGVPISTLQAISHPLANIAIVVQGGRNLARRAAWFLDNEPDERPELAPSAFVFMAEEAAKAATMAVHIQGGLGVSAEAAATAYLVRARGWALAGGDPGADRQVHRRNRRSARERRTELVNGFLTSRVVGRRRSLPQGHARVSQDPRDRGRQASRSRDGRQLRRRRASGAGCRGLPGERVEAGIRRRVQPGAAAHLGTGEAAGPRAVGHVGHHGDGDTVGGVVRIAGAQGRGVAGSV
jgi:alkylation response protein AidB-like acyl-CoA dehydrogenase